MAPATMHTSYEVFLATMKEIKTLKDATTYLPNKYAAYNLIMASINRACTSLGEQYTNAIHKSGLSHSEQLRLVDLYGLFDGTSSAKGVLKIILDSEVHKTNGSGTEEEGDKVEIGVRQCLLDIWRSLQSEKLDKNEVEKATLLALFTQSRATKKGDAKPRVPAWSVPLASALFPDKSLRASDLTITPNLAREVLFVQSEKGPPGMDESALEVETRRLMAIHHSPSERHIRLRYRDPGHLVFDFRMNSVVDGGMLMDRLKLICPMDCKIFEVVNLPGQMESREKKLGRKRGLEAISE
ncbi:MAG: hypothetical protein Q9184_005767 [Pyrenodesmia sp. 2 TL-2023]